MKKKREMVIELGMKRAKRRQHRASVVAHAPDCARGAAFWILMKLIVHCIILDSDETHGALRHSALPLRVTNTCSVGKEFFRKSTFGPIIVYKTSIGIGVALRARCS